MSLVDEIELLDAPEYTENEPPFGPYNSSFMWPVPFSLRSCWALPRQFYYRRWPVQFSISFIWTTSWTSPPSTLRRKRAHTPACWLPNQNQCLPLICFLPNGLCALQSIRGGTLAAQRARRAFRSATLQLSHRSSMYSLTDRNCDGFPAIEWSMLHEFTSSSLANL